MLTIFLPHNIFQQDSDHHRAHLSKISVLSQGVSQAEDDPSARFILILISWTKTEPEATKGWKKMFIHGPWKEGKKTPSLILFPFIGADLYSGPSGAHCPPELNGPSIMGHSLRIILLIRLEKVSHDPPTAALIYHFDFIKRIDLFYCREEKNQTLRDIKSALFSPRVVR